MSIEWINENTAVINNGSKLKFSGMLKGHEDIGEIIYIANTKEELTHGLVLEEWDYEIKEVI